ncbi:MAG: dynamin family protein [Alicyclobacillaceae bacterium]|nr:dynamin family protein [Alicyclobacillaceae bacterium]
MAVVKQSVSGDVWSTSDRGPHGNEVWRPDGLLHLDDAALEKRASWIMERLEELETTLHQEGDASAAARVRELRNRTAAVAAGTSPAVVTVAFCGLFSAGKSSLVNRLCGSGALATGAVPTTEQAQAVALPGAGGQVVLVDTPGIDSTVDAHRLETERVLESADCVVVVMDYQHVESEPNVTLSRRLAEEGRRLWLVVNQMDKHLEWEIPFAQYRARIERAFADAGVRWERIFYTAAEGDGWAEPDNEDLREVGAAGVERLAEALQELGDVAPRAVLASVVAQACNALDRHVERLWESHCQRAAEGLRALGEVVPGDAGEARTRLNRVRSELAQLDAAREARLKALSEAQRSIREQWVRSVELAQIAPYETTERGRSYVESLRPEFRVGWLRSKRKTAQEQVSRLERFAADLAERTEKFLVWPLQNSLRQFVRETEWANDRWLEEVDHVAVKVTPAFCQSLVKQGALVSTQYPYQYVKDVVHAVKRQVFVRLTERVDAWFAEALQLASAEDPAAVDARRRLEALQTHLEVFIKAEAERVQRVSEWMERVMQGA